MSANNKAILQRANAAITRGDHEGFLAHCTEDVEWTFVGDRTLTGKAAIRQYINETYLEPPQFDVAHLIAEGDTLVATGQIAIKEANGTKVHFAYCDVWRLREGQLAELTAYVVEIKREG
ncbi:MAG TPA: nuclear transport factor 2 family protein [Tepidisphaeraceae bacterium]|nr:nuclear transport factor 2 family protein [Tepidisphaeraceae bacterium]